MAVILDVSIAAILRSAVTAVLLRWRGETTPGGRTCLTRSRETPSLAAITTSCCDQSTEPHSAVAFLFPIRAPSLVRPMPSVAIMPDPMLFSVMVCRERSGD